MTGLFSQIQIFALTLILGLIACGIFQYYHLTVRSSRPGKYSLYLLDFILWIFLILLVFVCMLIINQGEMRIYVLLALVIGAFIYYRFLWEALMSPLSRLARSMVGGMGAARDLLQKPVVIVKKYLKNRKKEPPPPDAVE